MSLKSSFVSFLNKKYPDLSVSQLDQLISDQLLSPFHVQLDSAVLQNIQSDIEKYSQMATAIYSRISNQYQSKDLRQPPNAAVCTSFDFHINQENQPELIEINTNAAFLALGLELYQFLNEPVGTDFSDIKLAEMFKQEIHLCQANPGTVYILDEKPSEQRLYVEFLVYQQVLQKQGFQAQIIDLEDIPHIPNGSLVYNRYTDFYLSDPKSNILKQRYNNGELHLTPHPYEYFTLADKQRQFDWNHFEYNPKPISLLSVYDLGTSDKEEIWSMRKKLFFKPKNSYGSKQAYKGSNISRTKFEEIFNAESIAQQFSEPSEIEVVVNDQPQKMKYDLRCYVYAGKLQLVMARLYQGQTTNLRTPGGGFAIVKFK